METTARTVVDKPIGVVWAALADHTAIEQWAPGLRVTVDDSSAEEPGGVGAVRRIKGGPTPAIVERVTAVEPGRSLSYVALGGVPFRSYGGTVRLTERSATSTEVAWTLHASRRLPVVEGVALAGVARVLLTLFTRAVRRG
ncbi:SRPBCC family protein [Nocardioides zeae]